VEDCGVETSFEVRGEASFEVRRGATTLVEIRASITGGSLLNGSAEARRRIHGATARRDRLVSSHVISAARCRSWVAIVIRVYSNVRGCTDGRATRLQLVVRTDAD
jgi:hypothetical protein